MRHIDRDYKPLYFYFEIVEFVRKFALTGILMLGSTVGLTRGSAAQIFIGTLIAFLFCSANCIVRRDMSARGLYLVVLHGQLPILPNALCRVVVTTLRRPTCQCLSNSCGLVFSCHDVGDHGAALQRSSY